METKEIYNNDFVAETARIKTLLSEVKEGCDVFDRSFSTSENTINYINKYKEKAFKELDNHFKLVWELVQDFSKEDMRRHQKYYQDELFPLFATPPLNKRVYEKPLGYPGDYLMMNYYYDDGYEGESCYHKLMHRYSLEVPVARANINRKKYFFNIFERICKLKGDVDAIKIASFGCGPAREIIEFAEKSIDAERCEFTCIDSEPGALNYIKDRISAVNKQINIYFLNLNIKNILKSKGSYEGVSSQNLIYSAGLFDYFSDKMAKAILNKLYSYLSDDGLLIIVNVAENHDHRAYMELLGEWYLNLRSDMDMLDLASDIKDAKNIYVEKDNENEKNLYLIIEK